MCVCVRNRVRASRPFQLLSSATFTHKIYFRPNWTRPSKIKSFSRISKWRPAPWSLTLHHRDECWNDESNRQSSFIPFVVVVFHMNFNGPSFYCHIQKYYFWLLPARNVILKALNSDFRTLSPIKFIERLQRHIAAEENDIDFDAADDANNNNYGPFLLIGKFGSDTAANERHAAWHQQQNMFRTDQIPNIPFQIRFRINHRREVFVEMGNLPLIDSCLRIACGQKTFESIAIRVPVPKREFDQRRMKRMSAGSPFLRIPTNERYIAKVVLHWSLFDFIEFTMFSLRPLPPPVRARLALNKLNHI